jgi:hypothetical protein
VLEIKIANWVKVSWITIYKSLKEVYEHLKLTKNSAPRKKEKK